MSSLSVMIRYCRKYWNIFGEKKWQSTGLPRENWLASCLASIQGILQVLTPCPLSWTWTDTSCLFTPDFYPTSWVICLVFWPCVILNTSSSTTGARNISVPSPRVCLTSPGSLSRCTGSDGSLWRASPRTADSPGPGGLNPASAGPATGPWLSNTRSRR